VWLLGLLCGVGAAVAPGFLAMAAILLGPAALAFFTDPSPGRARARPVLLLGGAMAIGPMIGLAGSGGGVGSAIALACEPRVLALAWSAQGAAWMAVELAPWVIRMLLEGTAHAQAMALRRARRGIEAEWGIPPREGDG
jgi:hypothetical protein